MAAIYQWYENGILYTILTTTIYPGELTDGMNLGVSLVSGRMEPPLDDQMDVGIESLGGSITLVLLISPTLDDAMDVGIQSLDGSITLILLISPILDDAMDVGIQSLDGNIISKLVEAVIEENGMDIGVSLVFGSMTPV